MIFCRGLWVADQCFHETSKSITPFKLSLTHSHDHTHTPILDHLHHDGSAEISDANHLVLHLLDSIDNPSSLPIALLLVDELPEASIWSEPPSPLPSDPFYLYRPPKALLAA
ncbi:hypothetical protein [Spartinivicinus poritis]|uniref:Uncharacterized protein n=1 Tax=Spartinivicinus poritis TaxID=2994640 RepID=A0ABT5U5N7_9GAMM|nr:hypothetical protein [Spartinivicinus sp. A2-2]MDE1460872.1 hypothetical protein [Spartinivicinus sp. A2-2]